MWHGAVRSLHCNHARPGRAVLCYACRRGRSRRSHDAGGLGTPEKPHPIQQAFIEEGAAQCGFCLSGVTLAAKAVLDVKPNASDQEIRDALGGILCRCFAHTRMFRAIRKYVEASRS
jgi:nicotinate dehydrogenase subunit A